MNTARKTCKKAAIKASCLESTVKKNLSKIKAKIKRIDSLDGISIVVILVAVGVIILKVFGAI